MLAGFIGRRGRTDFARARRRSRLGGWGSAGIFAGLVLVFYGPGVGMGGFGELLGELAVGDEPRGVRPDQRPGEEIADDRGQPKPLGDVPQDEGCSQAAGERQDQVVFVHG